MSYLWPANDKFAGRLEVVDCFVVKILVRYDSLDDVLHEVSTQLFDADLLRMLNGDDNGVHTQRHTSTLLHPVLARHLTTAEQLIAKNVFNYEKYRVTVLQKEKNSQLFQANLKANTSTNAHY